MFMTDEKPKRKRKRTLKLEDDDCAVIISPENFTATFAHHELKDYDNKFSENEYILLGLLDLIKDPEFVDYVFDHGIKCTKSCLDSLLYKHETIDAEKIETLEEIDNEIGAIFNNEKWS